MASDDPTFNRLQNPRHDLLTICLLHPFALHYDVLMDKQQLITTYSSVHIHTHKSLCQNRHDAGSVGAARC